MLETAALYIVIAIGKKLLDHAGNDAGDAFDKSLGKLAQWVKQKVAGNPTGEFAIATIAKASAGEAGEPDRKNGSNFLTIALQAATADDPVAARELEDLLAELKRDTPPELILNGTLRVKEVLGGTLIGAKIVGTPHGKATATGTIDADLVKEGTVIGVLHQNG
jgi:hypothetical protein